MAMGRAVTLLLLAMTLALSDAAQPDVKARVTSVYATIFESELMQVFGFSFDKPIQEQSEATQRFTNAAQELKRQGFTMVMLSQSWAQLAPWTSTRLRPRFHVLDAVTSAVCSAGLQVSVVVDLYRTPSWHTLTPAVDSTGRAYPASLAMGSKSLEPKQFLAMMLRHLTTKFNASCFHSIQPSFSNEYELKYTQEYDCFQDYSPDFVLRYRQAFKALQPSLGFWNTRWGTKFPVWAVVEPPKYCNSYDQGSTGDASHQYWDFMWFRRNVGVGAIASGCAKIHEFGLKCIAHIPEFYSTFDAIYGSYMFTNVARGSTFDYLIMDTNFMTMYHKHTDPLMIKSLVGTGLPYKKPLYVEAAYERNPDKTLVQEAMRNALLTGVDGIGITNWLQWMGSEGSPQAALSAAVQFLPALPTNMWYCSGQASIAVLAPMRSFESVRGLRNVRRPDGSAPDPDPFYSTILRVLKQLPPTDEECNNRVHFFPDVALLAERMASYAQVHVIVPLVLSTSEHDIYTQVVQTANSTGKLAGMHTFSDVWGGKTHIVREWFEG